ncbi:MAG: hypothetical protein AB7G37_17990 [Solirubrobacteraceae bacterium]
MAGTDGTATTSGVVGTDPSSGATRSYGSGARILSLGIASTGLLTFLFFSVASHALGDDAVGQEQYGQIATMWAILFTAMSVMYRPVEQLLSRSIATARARGDHHPSLREPLLIQAGFAALLVIVALVARGPLEDELGSSELFWILVAAGVAYGASYFARGFVAGHGWFGLYGGLVLFESLARILFPIAAVIGITSGQTAVAVGILAAPLASLAVVPWAIRSTTVRMARPAPVVGPIAPGVDAPRRVATDDAGDVSPRAVHELADGRGASRRGAHAAARDEGDVAESGEAGEAGSVVPVGGGASRGDRTLRRGGAFAVSVALIQLGEQTLVNAGVLLTSDKAVAAVIFSALLVTRAPLQLFQAIQTTLLPHFAALVATGSAHEIAVAIRKAVGYIAAFAGAVAVGLLVLGGWVMPLLFAGQEPPVGGLAIVAVGMGAHLTAGTINQAALARGHAASAAAAWLVAGGAFVVWMLVGPIDDALLCAEVGYTAATFLLCAMLAVVFRRPVTAEAHRG